MGRFPLLLIQTLCWGLPVAGTAPRLCAHTFTSIDGRKLDGKILDANSSEVTIRRKADGRDVKVPLSTLSESDVKVITEWRSARAMSKVTFTATKDKLSSAGRPVGGGSSVSSTKIQQWMWVITVKNGTAHPLKGVTVRWGQVVERTDRNQGGYSGPSKTAERRSEGVASVPEIPPFGSVRITTSPMDVLSHKSVTFSSSRDASGDSVTTATSYKWDEALSGLGVELTKPGHAPIRWKTGTDPGLSAVIPLQK